MSTAGGLRPSHHVRSRLASRFFKAAKYSEGRPHSPNLFVTLNLTHTACPPQKASKAVADLCSKFGRWLRYQSKKAVSAGQPALGPPTYEVVLEAPGGIHHAHWLVFVPDEVKEIFRVTLPKWLEKVAGDITVPVGAIHIEPIREIMALSRYCMKGVDRHHARRCYVRPTDQGVVWGKRVFISRSLGPTARQKTAASLPIASRPYGSGSTSRTGLASVAAPPST